MQASSLISKKWIALTAVFALAAALFAGFRPGTSSAAGTPDDPPPVNVPSYQWAYNIKQSNPEIALKKGTTFLSLNELSTLFSDLVLSYDQTTRYLIATAPNLRLKWRVGSSKALINDSVHAMSTAPFLKNGKLFVPLRDIVMVAGATMKLDTSGTLLVGYGPRSLLGGSPAGWYWVRKDNGNVYTAVGSEMPRRIGYSGVRVTQYGYLDVKKTGETSLLLTVTHSHGEPALGTDIYRLVVSGGKLVRETAVEYYGMARAQSVEEADGLLVLLDGSELQLVRPDGYVQERFDLKALGGYDDTYTVEYASVEDRLLLIRPYIRGTTLLVDLRDGSAAALYKELLSEEEITRIETTEPSPFVPDAADNLTFVKRDGDSFVFDYRNLFTGEQSQLTYTLQ